MAPPYWPLYHCSCRCRFICISQRSPLYWPLQFGNRCFAVAGPKLWNSYGLV